MTFGRFGPDGLGDVVKRSSRIVVLAQILFAVLLVTAIVVTLQASANPMAPSHRPDTTFRLTEPISGIALLFFMNILVNLLCYSGLLLAFAKRYPSISGIKEMSGRRFFVAVVSAVVVISLIGAAVDFYLVTQPRFIDDIYDNSGQAISGTYRVVVLDVVNWTAALSLIAMSVIACSYGFLRLRASMGLLIAIGFVIVNLAFWIMVGVFGEAVTYLTFMFGVLSAPIVVRALVRWYSTDRPLIVRSWTVPQG